jgi:hypothetical protein
MSDLPKLRIWDEPAIRGALSWYLNVAEIGVRPSFALPRHLPRTSILRQAARVSSGPSSTVSRRFFSIEQQFLRAGASRSRRTQSTADTR